MVSLGEDPMVFFLQDLDHLELMKKYFFHGKICSNFFFINHCMKYSKRNSNKIQEDKESTTMNLVVLHYYTQSIQIYHYEIKETFQHPIKSNYNLLFKKKHCQVVWMSHYNNFQQPLYN